MQIRALILDFDGTIVTEDISDLLCNLVGKKKESAKLNQLFFEGRLKGLEGLIQRINFLQGLSLDQIREVVSKQDYLRPGAQELFQFLKTNQIISIIASGSILPLLEIYQEKLGVDYLVGSKPRMNDNKIVSICEQDYSGLDFKVRDSKRILDALNIPYSSVVAIGDSPADKGIFELAAKSIAINPQAGIEKYADYVIQDDLSKAIPILESWMKE